MRLFWIAFDGAYVLFDAYSTFPSEVRREGEDYGLYGRPCRLARGDYFLWRRFYSLFDWRRGESLHTLRVLDWRVWCSFFFSMEEWLLYICLVFFPTLFEA